MTPHQSVICTQNFDTQIWCHLVFQCDADDNYDNETVNSEFVENYFPQQEITSDPFTSEVSQESLWRENM